MNSLTLKFKYDRLNLKYKYNQTFKVYNWTKVIFLSLYNPANVKIAMYFNTFNIKQKVCFTYSFT